MNDHVHPIFRTILADVARDLADNQRARQLRDQHLRDGERAILELARAKQRIHALELRLAERSGWAAVRDERLRHAAPKLAEVLRCIDEHWREDHPDGPDDPRSMCSDKRSLWSDLRKELNRAGVSLYSEMEDEG